MSDATTTPPASDATGERTATGSWARACRAGAAIARVLSIRVLFVSAAALLCTGLLLAFWYAPTQDTMGGFAQKIFFFHVPIAVTSAVAYFVAFLAGIAFLNGRTARWDAVGVAAIRLGLLFSALVMATGMIWAKAAWGVWWDWEPRLTTYLIACLLYAGYFVLRATVEEESRRATFSAVFAIIAFLDMPLTFFATRLVPANSELHPIVITTQSTGMSTPVAIPFFISMVGMVLLFFAFLRQDLGIARAREELESVKNRLGS